MRKQISSKVFFLVTISLYKNVSTQELHIPYEPQYDNAEVIKKTLQYGGSLAYN